MNVCTRCEATMDRRTSIPEGAGRRYWGDVEPYVNVGCGNPPLHLHQLRQPNGHSVPGGGLNDRIKPGPGGLDPLRPQTTPEPQSPRSPVPAGAPRLTEIARRFQEGQGQAPAPDLPFAEERLGQSDVGAPELRSFGSLGAARHLMTLLARRRSEQAARAATVREAVQLLAALEEGGFARKVLLTVEHVGRIVDIYPLELLYALVDEFPGDLPNVTFGTLILNKEALETTQHDVGAIAAVKVPLSAKLKSFALEGGGRPGYVFAPGPPATYLLEVHEAGCFDFLVLGELKRKRWVDRVRLHVGG